MSGIIITPENGDQPKLYIELLGNEITISDQEAVQDDSTGQWMSFRVEDVPEIVKALNDLASR